MRIGLCKRRAPVPPRGFPGESAAPASVVIERPEGMAVAELSRELLTSLPGDDEGEAVDRAVDHLVSERLLRIESNRVLPGALFGSAMAAQDAPSSN